MGEGIPAAADEPDDPIEPPLAAGDLERRAGREPEAAETGDESEVEIPVPGVVRDVQEDIGASLTARRPVPTPRPGKPSTSRPSRRPPIRLASQWTRFLETPNSAAVSVGSGKGVEITVFIV